MNSILKSNEKITNVELFLNPKKTNDNYYELALKLTIEDNWHIYWINPGDAGFPTKIDISVNEQKCKYEITYPTPKYFYADGIFSIGYDKYVIFPIKLYELKNILKNRITIEINALACNDICEPVYIKKTFTKKNIIQVNNFLQIFEKIPNSNHNITYSFTEQENNIEIEFNNIPIDLSTIKNANYYPSTPNIFVYQSQLNFKISNNKLIISLTKNLLSDKKININGILEIATEQKNYYYQLY